MEISTYYGYRTVFLVPESEDGVTNSPRPMPEPESQAMEDNWGEDRFALVRLQNLASPAAQEVDLKQALALLRQVEKQFADLTRQELRDLYQFDRLRDLCCQIEPQGEF